MIAGFDPSLTHFGWVVFDENKVNRESVLEAGVFKTGPKDGLLIQRFITQRERIRLFLETKNIKFVSMEAPFWGDFSTEILFTLNQFIHEVFLDLGVFVLFIQPASWKKLVFPSMDPKEVTKHHSTYAAKKELNRMGRRFSEHVADAYHIGKIGHRFYNWFIVKKLKNEDLTPAERDLFCGKHTFSKGAKKGITEYYGLIYRENDQFYDYSKQTRGTIQLSQSIREEVFHGGKKGYFESSRIL